MRTGDGSRAGRKPKLTEELEARIVALVAAGNFYEVAAAASGIGKTTFWRWMQDGEDKRDPETGAITRRARPRFREFREAVIRARAEAEATKVTQLSLLAQQGGTAGVKALCFWLERAAADRWGRKDSLTVDGEVSTTQRVTHELSEQLMAHPDGARAAAEVLAVLSGVGLPGRVAGRDGVVAERRTLDSGAPPAGAEPPTR